MKKLIILILLFSGLLSVQAQSTVDSLVEEGIKFHDKGDYQKAISLYLEALKSDPNSTLVNYELSLSYMSAGDNENAIKHSDIVINQNQDLVLEASINKGSALDNMGKTEESIIFLENILQQLGGHYLLYYNLGVNYYKTKRYGDAIKSFESALGTKPNHPGSHFMLGLTMYTEKKRVQSLLSLYYFLLFEKDTRRATTAYSLIKEQLGGNVTTEGKNKKDINISVHPDMMESEFSAAELAIALLEATNHTKENKKKPASELFIDNTTTLFKILGQLKENEEKTGFWWNFYVPFFYELAESDHMQTYCNFITPEKESIEWMKSNPKKLNAFIEWLKKQ